MAQYTLNIRRTGAGVVASHKVQDDTILTERFFGQSQITSRIESQEVMDIEIGDYVRWNNVNWFINQQPNITKNSSNNFIYNITFEAGSYNFLKVQYLSSDSGEFYLTGDAEDFIDLIITNMNRIYTGYPNVAYSKGTIDQSDTSIKTLHFKDENCRQVIQRICSEFSGEIYLDATEINFTDKLENATGVSLAYKSGLRNISKIAESEKNIITRLYGYGSDKNLGTNYRSGQQRLEFDDGGNNYLENNVATYGTIEATKTFEDIYPHRTGTVTSVGTTDVFTDSAMDFDVNSYLISGVSAKVHFNTGSLAGYEFEIETYVNATKTFTLIPIKTAIGIDELPNVTLKPASTDEYVILGITMPAGYITTAETELEAATQAWLDTNSEARVKYEVTADNHWFKEYGQTFHLADTFTIDDDDLGVVTVRITELSYPLYDPYKYKMIISNFTDSSVFQKLIDDDNIFKDDKEIDKGGDIPRSWGGWITTEGLRAIIVAPDGYIRVGLVIATNIITGKLSSADGNTYFDLDNNTLVIGSGSGIANFSDAGDLAVLDEVGAGDCDTTIISGGKIITGLLTATNIITGKLSSADGNTYFDLDNNVIVMASGAATIAGTNITSIADGATAGATWGSNLSAIPTRFTDTVPPAGSGLCITASYLGYYTGGAFTAYLDNAGNLVLGDVAGGNPGLAWNQAASSLSLTGSVSAYKTGTDQRVLISGADGNISFYNEADVVGIELDFDTYAYGIIGESVNGGNLWVGEDSGNYAEIAQRSGTAQFCVFHVSNSSNTGDYFNIFDHRTTGKISFLVGTDDEEDPVFTVGTDHNVYIRGNLTLGAGATVDTIDVGAHIHNAVAGQGAKITYANLLGIPASFTPTQHDSSHENGGADEIDVTGLTGVLDEAQSPADHQSNHHLSGSDELSVLDLKPGTASDGLWLGYDAAEGGLYWGTP